MLWIGQTISLLGDNVFTIALAWEVILLTGSSAAMGLVVVAQLIPTTLFVLLGGVIADQLPRKLIMLCSDIGRGLVVLIVAASAFFMHVKAYLVCFPEANAREIAEALTISPSTAHKWRNRVKEMPAIRL